MVTTAFVRGWTVTSEANPAPQSVELPHDAMIAEPRSAEAASWAHGAYSPGGKYVYRKDWTPGDDIAGKQVALRFEGVFRRSTVLLEGRKVGGCVSGYREFEVRLDPYLTPDRDHVIEVVVDNSEMPAARWYTGSGIYRPVWLELRDRIHVPWDGVAVTTKRVGKVAVVAVDVSLANPEAALVTVVAILARGGQRVVDEVTTTARSTSLSLQVDGPAWWSAENPALYDLQLELWAGDRLCDRVQRRIGLRTVEAAPGRGLLVNGTVVKLRGANVHHDQGVLGAATFAASERRRVRILKDAGFNAIRSAHNPASRALLEACDELGIYVLDEAYDGWYDHKTAADDADAFDSNWQAEVAAMVGKDRTHPSVIMYSIGNENGEAFTPRGRRTASALAAEVRRLDPTRPVTIGVNLVGATFAGLAKSHIKDRTGTQAQAAPDMTSTALNVISNKFGVLMKLVPRLKAADVGSRAIFELVDVAGYNYGTARYQTEAALHPYRLMLGTESMPGDLPRNWELAQKLPNLIGDFVWAGWDYLGEAGGGSWSYGQRSGPFLKPYPQLLSGMGIIDATGLPGATVRLAQAAWGLLRAPAITVRPLDLPSGPVARTTWRASDAVESWSWHGHEGRQAELEIYSADDEVEVLVNGRSLGRKPAGARRGYVARFTTRYEPGAVEAVGYRHGIETSRSHLLTASPARLTATLESDDPTAEVLYVAVQLTDDDGIIDTSASDTVTVTIAGPATLAGFGNAAPATEESFTAASHTTYRGRALAVVRRRAVPGDVTFTATSRTHGTATLVIPGQPFSRAASSSPDLVETTVVPGRTQP